MRLSQLKHIYRNQDIYIIGSGPTSSLFPYEFFLNKVCMSLNDSYKIDRRITPIAFMHHQVYSRNGNQFSDDYHEYFKDIKYPIIKATGRDRTEAIDWDNPLFYFFDYSHIINDIWTITKDTDVLYYTPEGCALQAALQVCWIMGAKNIFLVGCDSRTMGGKHYANYDKNGFRDDEVLKRSQKRNYDSYIYGMMTIQNFLQSKGIHVFNLSTILGYHLIDFQYDFQSGAITKHDLVKITEQK